jgi:hypothetical protein
MNVHRLVFFVPQTLKIISNSIDPFFSSQENQVKSKNMQYMIAFVMSIVVAVSISACGTPATPAAPSTDSTAAAPSTDSTAAAPSTDSTAAAPTAAAPAAADVVAKFDFSNTGTLDICQLFLSPTTTNEWGPDQLAGQKIPAGQKFTLTNIPAGTYDAKAVACDGTTEATIQVNIKNP